MTELGAFIDRLNQILRIDLSGDPHVAEERVFTCVKLMHADANSCRLCEGFRAEIKKIHTEHAREVNELRKAHDETKRIANAGMGIGDRIIREAKRLEKENARFRDELNATRKTVVSLYGRLQTLQVVAGAEISEKAHDAYERREANLAQLRDEASSDGLDLTFCALCLGKGVIDSGNGDFPCSCLKGDTAIFNVAGRDAPITGVEFRKLYGRPREDQGTFKVVGIDSAEGDVKIVNADKAPPYEEPFTYYEGWCAICGGPCKRANTYT